jgi:hypothetical protein
LLAAVSDFFSDELLLLPFDSLELDDSELPLDSDDDEDVLPLSLRDFPPPPLR